MSDGTSPSKICGHVFVLHCSVEGIASDGILRHNDDLVDSTVKVITPNEDDTSTVRVYEAGTSNDKDDDDASILSIFQSYLEMGADYFHTLRSPFGRGKPLLSLEPTSFLTSNNDTEKVLTELLTFSYSLVDKFGVDVALCIPKKKVHISTQSLRMEVCPFSKGPFWMLSAHQKENCAKLANDAKVGRLTVFVGAGISMPSGAPSWEGLLDLLAIKAGLSDEDRKLLKDLDYLDQPTILEEEMGEEFKPAIAEIMKESSRYTPAHTLLKSFQAPAVTTNYDDLYERAAASCDKQKDRVPTLPWDSRTMLEKGHAKHNSLLKLHGCINHPESIILSRQDYMRYPDTSQALRGRLHSLFLTSQILFCGFSMTDDNVHKIIDDVRKVLYVNGEPTKEKFGTILSMTGNKMFDRLWDQDFYLQSFGMTWDDNPSWFHDCFLEYMVSLFVTKE